MKYEAFKQMWLEVAEKFKQDGSSLQDIEPQFTDSCSPEVLAFLDEIAGASPEKLRELLGVKRPPAEEKKPLILDEKGSFTDLTIDKLHRLTISFDGSIIMGATVTCPRPENSEDFLALFKELVRMHEAPDQEDKEVLGEYSPREPMA